MERLLYGAAYYDEYMPYERLQEDIHMMKEAGINVVRIAESTWSTEESQEGVFDFSHVTKVLDAMQEAGICVIVGTPTYAIPVWMAKKYPEVMVMNSTGQRRPYGARQIMDITNKEYRFFAERIIRKLMEAVQRYSCVIGFQLDNETKHYGTCSANVQEMFAVSMKKKYEGDLEQLNQDFGLAYWSNRINTWDEFPSVIGTINGSLGCAFASFQRSLVTEYLDCQRRIVEEYRRPEQFVTHNFDFEWRGYSFGVQPDVDHYETAKCVTRAGCDIYHPTQEHLTGKEIGFCGDLARSLKRDNYFVMETQAQGFPNWTPFDGQLRLQAFSHLASGADAVMYWHWHSIHNACETYWKGVLSHNLKENAAYLEVKRTGVL
jgi:beta-galactosidase